MEDILAKRTEINVYAKWRKFEDETQDDRINEVIDGLEMSPTKWTIDFEEFNTVSKIKLLNKLKEFFETYIAERPESKDMNFVSRSIVSGRRSH